MAASTLANLANAYKELFPQRRLEQTANRDRDLFKWVKKKDDLTGYASSGGYYYIPVKYGKPQGIGRVFASAQANVTSGKVARFALSRKKYYGFVTIDEETIAAARDRTGAFYDVKEGEIEDMIGQVSEELEKHMWRDGNGSLGVVGSISTTTITLATATDVSNFNVGMVIGANTLATGAGTDKIDTASYTAGDNVITKIDLDAGTLTTAGDLSDDTAALAATHFLFRGGTTLDVSADGDAGAVVEGLAAWIPSTAESSGTFLGQDRTLDVQRLQGFRQAYVGSIEETIKKLHSKMRLYSAKPDCIWLSHTNWHRLEQELGARAVRQDGSAATFGLPTLKYMSPSGPLMVYAGSFCPDNRGYLLRRDTWTLHHLKGLPHLVTTDGLRMLRAASEDSVEVRCRYWCELACHQPMDNGVFTIT